MENSIPIKTSIAQGTFESITHYAVRALANKLLRRPAATPLGRTAFGALLAALFGLLFLLGTAANRAFGAVQVRPQVLAIFALGAAYIYMLCLVVEWQIEKMVASVNDDLVDALPREEDRQSLRESMQTIFSLPRQLWFGILFSLLAHTAFIAVDPSLVGQFGAGFLLANLVFHAFHGFCIYFYFANLEWLLSDLKTYHFDLFELDPASTDIIPKIAAMLQSTITLITLMTASATIILSSTRVLPFASVAAMVFLMWASTISLFFLNRHVLKSIVLRAKWDKLTRIQEQIRELERKDRIPTRETLELINQLKAYHDMIKNSPDSPWHFGKFLNTLNTLIWPTFGVVATNVGGFLDFVRQISEWFGAKPGP